MPWFRKTQLEPLAVTMAGVKLGDRLLVIGAGDAGLTAALASRAGLTGRACVLDQAPEATRAAAVAVERQGALIESFTAPWRMLPFDAQTFDVVIIRGVLDRLTPEARLRAAAEAHRVLRPGGRTVVIEDAGRSGLAALWSAPRTGGYERSGGAPHALEAAGFKGVRTLAEREGHVFVEGIKPAAQPASQ